MDVMEYKRLRASQIRLDPQNPRLPDGTDTDLEAVNRLLAEGYQGLFALARDLVETGESNPTDLPIVMRDGRKFLVLEGNRRFAALKLLADPDLADDAKARAAFKRLAGRGSAPATVYCAVFPDRASADHWLVLRHTGANNGVGVRQWSPEQIATHRKRMNAPVDSGTARSIAIADELQEAFARDADLVDVIRRVRAGKLTNIGRFFASDVLARLNLSVRETDELYVRERTLWAKHTATVLHPFFAWAMRYIDENSVDAYKNAEVRRKVLDEHVEVLPDDDGVDEREATRLADSPYTSLVDAPDGQEGAGSGGAGTDASGGHESASGGDAGPDGAGDDQETGDEDGANQGDENGTSDSTSGDPDDSTSDNSGGGDGSDGSDGSGGSHGEDEAGDGSQTDDVGTGAGGDGGTAPRKNEAKPEKRLFQDLKLPHLSRRTQRLLKEAREVEHEQAAGIACVMSRVIVELAVSEPDVLAWSGAQEKQTFADKVVACLKALDDRYDKGRPNMPTLTPAYMETQHDFGVQYLNQFVHNPTAHPDPHHSRRYSQVWRPFLDAVNNRTGLENA